MKWLAKQRVAGVAPRAISVLDPRLSPVPLFITFGLSLPKKRGGVANDFKSVALIITDKSHQGAHTGRPTSGKLKGAEISPRPA